MSDVETTKSIFRSLNKNVRLAKSYYRESKIHENNNRQDEAIRLLKSANKIFQENSCFIQSSQCFLDLAVLYSHYGDYHKAIEYNKSAKWILRKQDKSAINDIYIEKLNIVYQFNKATIFYHLRNYRRSLELYQKLEDKWKDRLSKDQLITINFNIASLYMFQMQYDKAIASSVDFPWFKGPKATSSMTVGEKS